VAANLTTLRSKDLEVTLHPSDLVVSGKEAVVAHARAVIAEQLAFSPAYMTWTKEANEVEDQLEAFWQEVRSGEVDGPEAMERLHQIEERVKRLELPYEEWEVLYRQQLLVERAVLRAMAGVTEVPGAPADKTQEPALTVSQGRAGPIRQAPRRESPVPGLILLALTMVLGWFEGNRQRRARVM
jgi:hypothetical protein